MNAYRTITGYCQTQKITYSVVLNCIDAGDGSYLKGTVQCNYVKYGGSCEQCSLRNNYPENFL